MDSKVGLFGRYLCSQLLPPHFWSFQRAGWRTSSQIRMTPYPTRVVGGEEVARWVSGWPWEDHLEIGWFQIENRWWIPRIYRFLGSIFFLTCIGHQISWWTFVGLLADHQIGVEVIDPPTMRFHVWQWLAYLFLVMFLFWLTFYPNFCWSSLHCSHHIHEFIVHFRKNMLRKLYVFFVIDLPFLYPLDFEQRTQIPWSISTGPKTR